MTITVREYVETDKERWDSYVAGHPEGTFCHRAGWQYVVQNGAGHQACFLVAEEEGKLCGVLPLTIRRSFLFGKAALSTMFGVYGGALADDETAYSALDEAAWQRLTELGVDTLEYRSMRARHRDTEDWMVDDTSAATFQRPLSDKEDQILLDIPRKQRAVVRKSLKNGLVCSWDKDLETFYALYAESVRNLGTPVFPKKLFESFLEEFPDETEIQIILNPDGKPVASLMSFYHGETVLPYYAGGSPDARRYGAHDFMYYQLMLRAAAKGIKVFDFGRSKVGTGPYKFKKNWGFSPTELQYETRVRAGCKKPDLSPTNKKFELMVKVWKKLPLPVANMFGPSIARHLG